ncbi:flagellar hook-basal body complex protein FliE [Kordiimonas gwangyangensis]|uniref:flagellar hook-basal body complex protein FliE n=1 Tax=Kordiimonas gwangyangensis TaxID=288022 RepID=UPI0003729A3D|nr:flagellar hook-basal body complex protein FliE [Kordiimonas gwangyangensis]
MNIKQLDAVNAYSQATKQMQSGSLGARDGMDGIQNNSAFGALVDDAIGNVQKATETAEMTSAKALVSQADMVDVVTAVSNAEMVVDTVISVRDKVISAYNDILKMPI